jgi:hypothetical protein
MCDLFPVPYHPLPSTWRLQCPALRAIRTKEWPVDMPTGTAGRLRRRLSRTQFCNRRYHQSLRRTRHNGPPPVTFPPAVGSPLPVLGIDLAEVRRPGDATPEGKEQRLNGRKRTAPLNPLRLPQLGQTHHTHRGCGTPRHAPKRQGSEMLERATRPTRAASSSSMTRIVVPARRLTHLHATTQRKNATLDHAQILAARPAAVQYLRSPQGSNGIAAPLKRPTSHPMASKAASRP